MKLYNNGYGSYKDGIFVSIEAFFGCIATLWGEKKMKRDTKDILRSQRAVFKHLL